MATKQLTNDEIILNKWDNRNRKSNGKAIKRLASLLERHQSVESPIETVNRYGFSIEQEKFIRDTIMAYVKMF